MKCTNTITQWVYSYSLTNIYYKEIIYTATTGNIDNTITY